MCFVVQRYGNLLEDNGDRGHVGPLLSRFRVGVAGDVSAKLQRSSLLGVLPGTTTLSDVHTRLAVSRVQTAFRF